MSNQDQPKQDIPSSAKRQNIRRLMAGLWSVFAALLLKESITAGYSLVETSPPLAAYIALAAVGILVWKQVMDCYIYFSHFDEYPLPTGPKQIRNLHVFFDNAVEFGVMAALLVLIHRIPHDGTKTMDLVSATWQVALVIECLWLVWDLSYALKYIEANWEGSNRGFRSILRSLWKSQKRQDKQFREWLLLNLVWAVVFFSLSRLTRSYVVEAWLAASILLVVMFSFAWMYITRMDEYFMG